MTDQNLNASSANTMPAATPNSPQGVSCTAMIAQWGEAANKGGKKLTAVALNKMLQGAGLITKAHVDGSATPKWVPTHEGERIGILLAEQQGDNGNVYHQMVFTPRAVDELLRRHTNGELPGTNSFKPRDRAYESWMDLFQEHLDERVAFLWNEWERADDEQKRRLVGLYRKARVQESDATVDSSVYEEEISSSFYTASYGAFNAFEYSVLFRILLENRTRTSDKRYPSHVNANLVSIGSGGEADLMSLLSRMYFKSVSSVRVAYTPVEIAKWPHRFSEWLAQHTDDGYAVPPVVGLQDGIVRKKNLGVCAYFNKDAAASPCKDDIFLFPKVLSEFEDDLVDEVVEGIRHMTFAKKEVFVCISHLSEACFEEGRASVKRGERIIDAFRQAMADTHDMVLGDELALPTYFANEGRTHIRCSSSDASRYPWFAFGPAWEHRVDDACEFIRISDVDRDFAFAGTQRMYQLVREMRAFAKDDDLKYPRNNCYARGNEDRNYGLAFQIVKFVKKA